MFRNGQSPISGSNYSEYANRILRGCVYSLINNFVKSSNRNDGGPKGSGGQTGFCVASTIAEPMTIALLAVGGISMVGRRRKK